MSRRGGSLTGLWAGVYAYPNGLAPPVAFTAWLLEHGGALSGHTSEPNSFGGVRALTLIADLAGGRSAAAVSFTKTYRGLVADRIRYSGALSADMARIEGRWTIAGPTTMQGSFVMIRSDAGRAKHRIAVKEEVAS
ncbi:MAG TPA: hypothetical protein VFR34_04380 [Paracoccaceae bacterium]|nr:hypothetical protein [Paracoccaceae bacterium]